ncbi:hypothetical protein D3C81_1683240 [compost metagenome]
MVLVLVIQILSFPLIVLLEFLQIVICIHDFGGNFLLFLSMGIPGAAVLLFPHQAIFDVECPHSF